MSRPFTRLARLVGCAVVVSTFAVAPAWAGDEVTPQASVGSDQTLEAYAECYTERMLESCMASTSVADFGKAVAAACDGVRKAHSAAMAAELTTAKGLTAEKATAEADRRIAFVETSMAEEYRKCVGEDRPSPSGN
jgi:hypothetical protein